MKKGKIQKGDPKKNIIALIVVLSIATPIIISHYTNEYQSPRERRELSTDGIFFD